MQFWVFFLRATHASIFAPQLPTKKQQAIEHLALELLAKSAYNLGNPGGLLYTKDSFPFEMMWTTPTRLSGGGAMT